MLKININNAKQYSMLTISNFGTMLLAFITNILMTNMLNETEYGSYRYIINIITMIVSFVNFGVYYSTARLLTSTSEHREKNLYGATVTIVLVISFLAGIIIFGGYFIVSIFVKDIDKLFLYALPLIFTVMLQRTFIYMLKGSNKIYDISLQTILPQILILSSYIILWIAKVKNVSFVLSLTVYAIAFLVTDLITIYRLKINLLSGIKKEAANIFREQRHNGFEIYKGSLLSVFAADVLNVAIGSISLKAEYAIYALSLSLSTPIIQIPATMGIIHFKKNANSKKLAKKEIIMTFLLSIIAYIGLNLVMLFFFPIVYGQRYSGTIMYVSILSMGYLFHGIGDYFNHFLNAHGKGSNIKKGSYICGITQVLLAVALMPVFQIWGLVISRVISSLAYFLVMFTSYIQFVKSTKGIGDRYNE
ncbi:lipopolysaccharide biosynthesis protein [Clostridium tunisiense]|uniref:lipopolysaccharide biosynthesis protein n=1 Tax=Clostridium tunisiense TaxID=219748 RepID=UPI0002D99D17|nr:oligosaccharide flippase family protein [Clostridium tunisiense]